MQTWRSLEVALVMVLRPGVRHSLMRLSTRICRKPPGCTCAKVQCIQCLVNRKTSAVSACNRCHFQHTLTELLKGMLTPPMAELQPQFLLLLLRLLLQWAADTVQTQHELPGLQQCFASLQEHLGHRAEFSLQLCIAHNQSWHFRRVCLKVGTGSSHRSPQRACVSHRLVKILDASSTTRSCSRPHKTSRQPSFASTGQKSRGLGA